jgi:hypothetical protein
MKKMKKHTEKDFITNFKGHELWMLEVLNDIDFKMILLDHVPKEKRQEMMTEIMKEPITHVYCQTCDALVNVNLLPGNLLEADSSCKYAKGCPEIVVNLSVPSGKIVLFNDLREPYKRPDRENRNGVNSFAGKKYYTEEYAKQGLITHFVGNSSPHIYQESSTKLTVASICEDNGEKAPPGKEIGRICTDLWWYCAVDKKEFEKRIGKTLAQYQKEYHDRGAWPSLIVAKVTPGTYRTTGRYDSLKKNETEIFSVIERIGE